MNEKEYELLGVRYCRFTKRIKVRLLETSYEYKKQELRVVKKKVKRVLKASSEVLDDLPSHEDVAVRDYCEQIAECVSERLYPVWYRRLLTERERDASREKLRGERSHLNEKYDIESAPYREEAKELSRALLLAYADAERADEELESARAEYGRFDEKSKGVLACLLWWKYSDKKRAILLGRVADADAALSQVKERIGDLECELYESTKRISECEQRRARELCELEARAEQTEREFETRLSAL